MNNIIDRQILRTLAMRSFRHFLDTPIAYIVGIFFYGFVGAVYGSGYFSGNQASVAPIGMIAPWVLWFVVPALTMGLLSEELRSGTYEHLSTLPLRDWEIVLGKFVGFALMAGVLVLGLAFYCVIVIFTSEKGPSMEWGAMLGMLTALFFLCLSFGAMGLFASSLTKSQVVALIIGMIFCTFFFFIGQFAAVFPSGLARLADFAGITSHVGVLSRGVWDARDLLYFASLTFFFLYMTVQRVSTRRF